jgi:glycosyltransferase involved in cell wall biosynthesis
MALTIGVVIPCHKPHIPLLGRLLWSINNQTHLPDMVIVSCSSSDESDILYKEQDYKFSLKIYTHSDKRNAAQNRNFGTRQLDTDIITYFDADDIMHPQRIEIINKSFINYPDIKLLLHSLQLFPNDLKFQKYNIDKIDIERGAFYVCKWGSICHKYNKLNIANGNCSIPKNIFTEIQFIETSDGFGKEDTLFNSTIINKYSDNSFYCQCDLTWYFPSRASC